MTAGVQIQDATGAATAKAVARARESLLARRHRDGYWSAELTADSTLESDYVLLQLWLYPPEGEVWNPATRAQVDRAVQSILSRQLPDGGFNIYPRGPSELSASVKAYFALKLGGIPATDPRMVRARELILRKGGLQSANSYVKINLSLFGLYPREHTPSIPPELILAGNLIYHMSAWTRAIVLPLAVVHASDPRRPVPAGFDLRELAAPGVSFALAAGPGRGPFLLADRALKLWEKYGSRRMRRLAVERCKEWIVAHTRHSEGLAAVYPAMQYTVMALDVLGYPPNHPEVQEARRQFNALMVDDGRRFFLQPCFSPVWDTAITAYALGESGDGAALERTADWLISKECRRKGDWAVNRPGVEPSGWYFEFANEHYPDIDDTAMVLLALGHAQPGDPVRKRQTVDRAVAWLVAMQSKDGGWAAFDADNDWKFLEKVPFADHNAMLDPSCPDITGRVLEALRAHGVPEQHQAVQRGVRYLINHQEDGGSWFGRWGVNYIYGTFQALRGLRAAGESTREAHMLRGGEWLRSVQNADGGWGESCESYDLGTYVNAPSTASQTAWAILGLLASGDDDSMSLQAGVDHLVRTQNAAGGWDEDRATGTGFPRVFYLTYHLYRDTFPLLALASYLRYRNQTRGELA
ncbi:MAG: squalene--hopene cyclase [Acidobacteria bacterium]|nr:squalene--hopene cyclase [Acidobacteriota bacterium]